MRRLRAQSVGAMPYLPGAVTRFRATTSSRWPSRWDGCPALRHCVSARAVDETTDCPHDEDIAAVDSRRGLLSQNAGTTGSPPT